MDVWLLSRPFHARQEFAASRMTIMSSISAAWPPALTPLEQLREARSILRDEADALHALSKRLDGEFCAALKTLADSKGCVIVTGVGKAGLIGQKIAATLSSTGTRAYFLHPVEAMHGDLGCVHADDVLLALSNSGETEEIARLIPLVKRLNVPIIALTATDASTLGSQADVTVRLGKIHEAGPHGLAPSTSTTAMLAVGDALALVLCQIKGFTPQQFAVFHPGGSLGRKLARVSEIMRKGDEVRIAPDSATIRDVFITLARPGRRTGAVMLVDAQGKLTGLCTDSDLARLLQTHQNLPLERPISEVMTRNPLTTKANKRLVDVVEVLSAHKISELPVVDDAGCPIGLIDITDVIGLMPADDAADLVQNAG
jgi:arabinose-5-phosphate isomerase